MATNRSLERKLRRIKMLLVDVDELFDLPLLRVAGFAAAPNNARREVKKVVDYVTKARGGEGAVREIIDLILSCRKTERPGQA